MRAPKDVLSAADFLILDALNRRPMTIPELGRTLQLSQTTVRGKVKRYEKNGIVIQGRNNKWHPCMVVWVAPAKDVSEAISGEEVVMAPKPQVPEMIELPVGAEKPLEEAIQAAEEPKRSIEEVVDLGKPEPRREAYRPPKTKVQISDKAAAQAKRMNIPGHLEGFGELSMGRTGKCGICKDRTTPVRYGTQVICPKCARGGR